ncbi:MAG: ATP-dependent helicase [Thermodesulfovibrionales bacterium]|nr:ATP-dependent helicase [Thermodesulfovibrionales bacterium]
MMLPEPSTEIDVIYRAYEKHKEDNNLLDFDDMLTRCYGILSTDQEVLEQCQNHFKYLLVDEMQDTNAIQYEIIKLIAKKHGNLFVVGDMLQCIYQWRSSDNSYIINMDKNWDDVNTINLNINYRCSKDIVDLSNKFAKCIPETKSKVYKKTVAHKDLYKPPVYSVYKNEFDEAEKIAENISSLVGSGEYSYNDFCILARTNAQLQLFETTFYSKNVPCKNTDGISFVDRPEIKLLISYLRLAQNINDDNAFEYLYSKPNRWLGKQFLNEVKTLSRKNRMSLYCAMFKIDRRNWRFRSGIDEISSVITQLIQMQTNNVPIKSQIQFVRKTLNIDSYVSKDISSESIDFDKIENMNDLESISERYTSITDFVTFLDGMKQHSDTIKDAVNLMTVHRSKGLEFPVVFIVGLNAGVFPHHKNDNISEEKRLMYVALTRAEKELYLSSTEFYRNDFASRSNFLDVLKLEAQ